MLSSMNSTYLQNYDKQFFLNELRVIFLQDSLLKIINNCVFLSILYSIVISKCFKNEPHFKFQKKKKYSSFLPSNIFC